MTHETHIRYYQDLVKTLGMALWDLLSPTDQEILKILRFQGPDNVYHISRQYGMTYNRVWQSVRKLEKFQLVGRGKVKFNVKNHVVLQFFITISGSQVVIQGTMGR